jgi:hypothetical protein
MRKPSAFAAPRSSIKANTLTEQARRAQLDG